MERRSLIQSIRLKAFYDFMSSSIKIDDVFKSAVF